MPAVSIDERDFRPSKHDERPATKQFENWLVGILKEAGFNLTGHIFSKPVTIIYDKQTGLTHYSQDAA